MELTHKASVEARSPAGRCGRANGSLERSPHLRHEDVLGTKT